MSRSWDGSSNAPRSWFCDPSARMLNGGDMSVPFTMIVEPTQYTLVDDTIR